MLKSSIKIRIAEYETQKGKKIVRKDWAMDLAITPQYLSAIIAGRKVPDGEIMFKIARKLDCKVDDLYIFEEE